MSFMLINEKGEIAKYWKWIVGRELEWHRTRESGEDWGRHR